MEVFHHPAVLAMQDADLLYASSRAIGEAREGDSLSCCGSACAANQLIRSCELQDAGTKDYQIELSEYYVYPGEDPLLALFALQYLQSVSATT
jgi:hypothetical protein